MVLEPFSDEELSVILKRAIIDKGRGLGSLSMQVEPDALEHIIWAADGDARTALNNLEAAASLVQENSSTTRTVKSITISSRPFTRACGAVIRMLPSIGLAAC
jgi:putative ATPase